MPRLRNTLSKEDCLALIATEDFKRKTVSFYRYVKIENLQALRDELYVEWDALGVLGRTYLASEGINAQISVPEPHWEEFVEKLYAHPEFKDIPFKVGLEQKESFWKLIVRLKKQIVADGLNENEYDWGNIGTHLDAENFNKEIEDGAVVVDMRNAYESRIGHFEGAICPDVDTFEEELPLVKEMLKDKKDQKILLYCTGGIRCEKASAYLKSHGFEDVNQLQGGIIQYAHDVRQKGLPNRFKGANYVFDERISERVSDDVLSECDQCDEKSDSFTNCANAMCNLLFIQCQNCKSKMENCCTPECQRIIHMSDSEQRALRKRQKSSTPTLYRKRVRPKLKDIDKVEPVFELK